MPEATCHCGAVRIVVPRKPRQITDCNCSICRRYGTLWAYYKSAGVRVLARPGSTSRYSWGHKRLSFVRCTTCGCIMFWEPVEGKVDSMMGVNARNFEPGMIEGVRVRRLDGASTWKYLD